MADFSGHLFLRAARRADRRTVLAAQSFRAPFHVSKPYWDPDSRVLLVQVVNPTAGILEGDRLESEVVVDPAAALVVTTPSASRVFQMRRGAAESRQSFQVGSGGWLEVMPEPLVPHRGSTFHQVTHLNVEPGGSVFYVDQLMAGRIGHGEAWGWDRLRLELTVRLGGDLILRERFDHTGEELAALSDLCGSGPSACFANGVLISPNVESGRPTWAEELSALHSHGVWCGLSELRRGGWSLRLVAADSIRLRETLATVRVILARAFPYLAVDLRKL